MALSSVLSHIPEWIRTDLSSKDSTARVRAEETLLAMITAALSENERNAA